eukprot:TRINITY_DN2866_c0_g1_i1.p1 TRINITY_DN2866_c0_g1~~TRINITY_DN2866_c0_g1_i1.p1  ORF type:complete len:325 (+),score=39.01 TRINITY_DN2866_c0_g1_i1:480-1454(+)
MKKAIIVLMAVAFSFTASAQYAVHDASVMTQLYYNARAELTALERNRTVLREILAQEKTNNSKTEKIRTTIAKFQIKTEEQIKELSARLGDPKLLSTGVSNSPEAKLSENRALRSIRSSVKPDTEIIDYDAKKLYGEESDPEYKYNVSEAAYVNFEKVLEENLAAKRNLVAKRTALALALKEVRSVSEVAKLNAALAVVNGKLETIREQEHQAFMKLHAQQIRNEQKERKEKDAGAEKWLFDSLNYNRWQNKDEEQWLYKMQFFMPPQMHYGCFHLRPYLLLLCVISIKSVRRYLKNFCFIHCQQEDLLFIMQLLIKALNYLGQ